MGIAYLEAFPTILVAILLMIPIILLIITLLQSLGIKIFYNKLAGTITTGDSVDLKFKIKNRFILPVVMGRVKVKFYYTQGDYYSDEFLPFSLGAFTTGVLSFKFIPEFSGDLHIRVCSVKIMDFLGLFSVNVRFMPKEYHITVMPTLMPVGVVDRASHFLQSAVEDNGGDVRGNDKKGNPFYKDRSGDDPSEVFRTREYQPGDKLSRADWKTTAKVGKLMIKDYSFPIVDKTLIIVDLNYEYQSDYHRRIQTALSLSVSILNTDNFLSMMWFDAKSGGFYQHHIEKDDDLYESMAMLVGTTAVPSLKFEDYMESVNSVDSLKQIFYITTGVDEELKNRLNVISDGIRRNIVCIVDEDIDDEAVSDRLIVYNIFSGNMKESLEKMQVAIY